MTLDTAGRLYITTHMGVQICDTSGRIIGIIPSPSKKWLANVAFAGPKFDEMFVTASDKVWKRATKVKGVLTSQPPFAATEPPH
jgi:sugar lactone lactonase YvrE